MSNWFEHVMASEILAPQKFINKEQYQYLSKAFGDALLDPAIKRRLLKGDTILLSNYGINYTIQQWIHDMNASSLHELGRCVMDVTTFIEEK